MRHTLLLNAQHHHDVDVLQAPPFKVAWREQPTNSSGLGMKAGGATIRKSGTPTARNT